MQAVLHEARKISPTSSTLLECFRINDTSDAMINWLIICIGTFVEYIYFKSTSDFTARGLRIRSNTTKTRSYETGYLRPPNQASTLLTNKQETVFSFDVDGPGDNNIRIKEIDKLKKYSNGRIVSRLLL